LAIKTYTSVFRNHQKIITVDQKEKRVMVVLHDNDRPWIERGGLAYYYQNGTLDELLNVSVAMPDQALEVGGKEYYSNFIIDAGLMMPFIEYRDKGDGLLAAVDDGVYATKHTPADVRRIEQMLASGNWKEAEKLAHADFQRFARQYMYYGSFGQHTEAYMRSLAVPVAVEAHLFGEDNQPLQKGPTSTSRLFDLNMRPGVGLRMSSWRHSEGVVGAEKLVTDRIEVTNDRGLKSEVHYGHMKPGAGQPAANADADQLAAWVNGNFEKVLIFRAFIGGPNERYRIADKTVLTSVHGNAERLFQMSNSAAKLDTGSVRYKTQRGMSLSDLPLAGKDAFDQYSFLQGEAQGGHLRLDALTGSFVEEKDNRGYLRLIMDGYGPEQMQANGYVRDVDAAKWIHFLGYREAEQTRGNGNVATPGAQNVLLFHEGIPLFSNSYRFRGSEDPKVYRERDWVAGKWGVHFDSDDSGYYMIYQAADRRHGGALKRQAFHHYGMAKYDVWQGKPGEPDEIWMYYHPQLEAPNYSVGVTGNDRELWRTFDHGVVEKNGHRYFVVIERDPARSNAERLLYPTPGWVVYKDGVHLAKRQEWHTTSEEYRGTWNFGDRARNSAAGKLLGLESSAVREAEDIVAELEKSGTAVRSDAPADLLSKDSTTPRLTRQLWLSGKVAAILAAIFALFTMVWFAMRGFVKPINLNSATAIELQQLFAEDEISRILARRRERGFFTSIDEIEDLLRTTRFRSVSSKLRVAGEGGLTAEDATRIRTAVTGAAGGGAGAEVQAIELTDPALAPVAPLLTRLLAIRDSHDQPILSAADARAALVQLTARLGAGMIDIETFQRRAASALITRAYWNPDGRMKPDVRDVIKSRMEEIYNEFGLDAQQYDHQDFMNERIKRFAAMSPPDEINFAGLSLVNERDVPVLDRFRD
ncbi:MAG: hypothetical protein JO102_05085, partial [Elusimicrobia bacterium]|nr:hypothetical protein [Elusimicrobiota bacterium]